MKGQPGIVKIFPLGPNISFGLTIIYLTTVTEKTTHALEMTIYRESLYNSEKVTKMCLEVDHGTAIIVGSFRNICSRDSGTDQLVHTAVGKDPWITSAQASLCTDKIKKIYVSPGLKNSLCFRIVLLSCDSPDIKEERFAIVIKLEKKPRHEFSH